jgi:methylmalonyl-CoA mutase N-terminal domain/subunit
MCSALTQRLEGRQVTALQELRASRDQEKVDATLAKLHLAANSSDNLIPLICDAVECYATVGEISGTSKKILWQIPAHGDNLDANARPGSQADKMFCFR